MFLGLAWYWWVIFVVAFLVALPLKIKMMRKLTKDRNKTYED